MPRQHNSHPLASPSLSYNLRRNLLEYLEEYISPLRWPRSVNELVLWHDILRLHQRFQVLLLATTTTPLRKHKQLARPPLLLTPPLTEKLVLNRPRVLEPNFHSTPPHILHKRKLRPVLDIENKPPTIHQRIIGFL